MTAAIINFSHSHLGDFDMVGSKSKPTAPKLLQGITRHHRIFAKARNGMD